MKARVVRVAVVAAALALSGCRRDRRDFSGLGPGASLAADVAPNSGAGMPGHGDPNPFHTNAYGLGQGATLYQWFNCTGCHAQGGGAIGPPLMDNQWLYGASAEEIYSSIANGRPNGMPAFGKRLGPDQVWQLVSYVQSLSGHVPQDVAPSRGDTMSGAPPPSMTKEQPIFPQQRDTP